MNVAKIAAGVLDVMEKLAPALDGTPASAVIAAGAALLDLVDEVKTTLKEDDAAVLQRRRDEFEPLVMAHLSRTIASLG